MNWNQTGMPAALVGRLGQRREIAEFKSVLSDAQNQVLRPVDVELMAEELVKSGGREFVEMVRELTVSLSSVRSELENANRRYERLVGDLRRRGVSIAEDGLAQPAAESPPVVPSGEVPSGGPEPQDDGLAEWEEWDRRFRSLLG